MNHPQSGILNRPPGHLVLVALSFNVADPAANRETVEKLREIHRREHESDLDETTKDSPKDQPSAETGELGFEDNFDRNYLTITVGFSQSGYDALGVPREEQPSDLIPIPWPQLGDGPQKADNGDLVLQVCSDSVYINEHVLRRVEEELGDRLRTVWTVSGVQRYTTRAGRTSKEEGRALIGFLDGTSNLNPRNSDDDAELVFVDPEKVSQYPPLPSPQPIGSNPYGSCALSFPPDLRHPPAREPEWTDRGTYMAVRASTIDMTRWDDTNLGDQERIIGRWKVSGASLDLEDDPKRLHDEPAYAQDPANLAVALASHVRKTGPRALPEDEKRRVFRRGYPLVQATLEGVQRGLVFICFGRTLSTQFEFMTRAWTINPHFPQENAGVDMLRSFESVLCGGYFFVPPLTHYNQPSTWFVPPPTV